MLQLMYNVHTYDNATCPHFQHPLWDTFVSNFQLWFPLIQSVWPLCATTKILVFKYVIIIIQLLIT
jgi:hypothetical protein